MTQLEWVKQKLHSDHYITRNECLRVYISRLGAIIHQLKEEGYEFETQYNEYEAWGKVRKDYCYKLKSFVKDGIVYIPMKV